MTDAALLLEVKKGLNLPITGTHFDGVLAQKIQAVKAFMAGAGVSAELTSSDLGTALIVIGVTDLWNIQSSEVRFSPAFHTILGQLTMASLPATQI